MSLFSFDPGLVLWTWIAFLVLLAILSRYAFPGLIATLKEREALIAKSVDDARAIEQQRAESASAHAKTLEKAKSEADALIRKARDEAEALRVELANKAEAEAQAIIDRAREQIAEERREAVQTLTREVATLVCDATEKVVGKSFSGETERAWVQEMAEQL